MGTKQIKSGVLTFWLIISASISSQAQQPKKLIYGLFLDNSASMRPQFDRLTQLGRAVMRQVHEHGRVSIFDFAEGKSLSARTSPNAEIEQSQDRRLLEETIDNVYVVGGETVLLDAIHVIATRLDSQANGAEKIIVLVTDGADRKSVIKPKQLIQELKDLKIRVYAIGLVNELEAVEPVFGKDSHTKAVELLRSITSETGGQAVLPKSERDKPEAILTQLTIPIS